MHTAFRHTDYGYSVSQTDTIPCKVSPKECKCHMQRCQFVACCSTQNELLFLRFKRLRIIPNSEDLKRFSTFIISYRPWFIDMLSEKKHVLIFLATITI